MEGADLAFAGIACQTELIRGGEVSSRELVELYLARIQAIGPRVNAFTEVLAERALTEAEEADRGGEGSLYPAPVALAGQGGRPAALGQPQWRQHGRRLPPCPADDRRRGRRPRDHDDAEGIERPPRTGGVERLLPDRGKAQRRDHDAAHQVGLDQAPRRADRCRDARAAAGLQRELAEQRVEFGLGPAPRAPQ